MTGFNDLQYLDWEEQMLTGVDVGISYLGLSDGLCRKHFKTQITYHYYFCCNVKGHKGLCAWFDGEVYYYGNPTNRW